jgi:hypothetical protein
MKPFWIAGLVVVFAVTAGVGAPAMAAQRKFKAKLTPLEEPDLLFGGKRDLRSNAQRRWNDRRL